MYCFACGTTSHDAKGCAWVCETCGLRKSGGLGHGPACHGHGKVKEIPVHEVALVGFIFGLLEEKSLSSPSQDELWEVRESLGLSPELLDEKTKELVHNLCTKYVEKKPFRSAQADLCDHLASVFKNVAEKR